MTNTPTTEEQVKAAARRIGFDAVRITTTEAPGHDTQMAAWLKAGMHGEMAYLEKRAALRAGNLDSENLLAGARSVVLVALSYDFATETNRIVDASVAPKGVVARYARGEDYHSVMWEKLRALATWIGENFPGTAARGFADSGPLRERELAARAGLGWQGKHTNLISLDLGNWFFLGAVLTTQPLAPDPPVQNHCGSCVRCIVACPTGAIIAPLTLDARRCISYLTIELKGAIPREFRVAMGNRIFGCDDCLAACPWNERAQSGQEMRLAARTEDAGAPNLLDWLEKTAETKPFKDLFRGTALLRPGREGLRRNICVALGNVGGGESVQPLAKVLRTDPAPVVRGHAAWALGQIAGRGDQSAAAVLKEAAALESDLGVCEEIAAARAI